MAKRRNIVRLAVTWTPSLEMVNRLIGVGGAMTIVKIGRVSMTADAVFEGGDVEDFNMAHLAAANMLNDMKATGEVHDSAISVTSRADDLPVYTVGAVGSDD